MAAGLKRLSLSNLGFAQQPFPMTRLLLRALSELPLRWIHASGVALGWVVYGCSRRYAARLRENLARSRLYADRRDFRRLLHRSIGEAGKSVSELLAVWYRPPERLLALVPECTGWEHVHAAQQRGMGIIFLAPHLGCFEIANHFLASRLPLTFLQRKPRMGWLAPSMRRGRERGQARGVNADLGGVRTLLRVLRDRGAVGILPDQVPSAGDGVWAEFFGTAAYTMTLIGRLQQRTGAAVLIGFAERLPGGVGYRIRLEPMALPGSDKAAQARMLNEAVERLVARCPAQYLWSYNRYKSPAGASPPC
jgi:Kdo2-lipid IVA lauroyltransferase/acyltransferase